MGEKRAHGLLLLECHRRNSPAGRPAKVGQSVLMRGGRGLFTSTHRRNSGSRSP